MRDLATADTAIECGVRTGHVSRHHRGPHTHVPGTTGCPRSYAVKEAALTEARSS